MTYVRFGVKNRNECMGSGITGFGFVFHRPKRKEFRKPKKPQRKAGLGAGLAADQRRKKKKKRKI